MLYQSSSLAAELPLNPELHLLNCSGENNLTASEFELEPSPGETLFVSTRWQANVVAFATIQLSVPFMFYLGFYHSFYLLSLVPLCSLCTPISPGVSLLNGASFWENEIPYPHRRAAFGLCLSSPERRDADRDLSNQDVQDRWAFWAECISKNKKNIVWQFTTKVSLNC